MAYTLITHTGGGLGANGGTSAAINTTGADLLVVGVAYDSRAAPTLTDSKGNTWTAGFAQTNISSASCQPYWCVPTSVGSGHTVTLGSASNEFSSVYFASFSGALQTSPKDQAHSDIGSGTTALPGSITPTENNELVICICAFNVTGAATISGGGMTLLDTNGLSGGNFYGGGMAYVIQTTAAAINPTWTFGSAATSAAESVSFKAVAAVGGLFRVAPLSGIGTGGPFLTNPLN